MATFKFQGVTEYIEALEKIGPRGGQGIIKQAVWEGAKIIADGLDAEIRANHTDSGDLADSLGLVQMRNDRGYINTKVNFAGYDRNGVPNPVKAAVLESGTSNGTHKATHFISRTTRSLRSAAEAAMAKKLDEKIGQIMEG